MRCVRILNRWIGLALWVSVLANASVAMGASPDFKVTVDVDEQEGIYKTSASFVLPMRLCQAYRYLTDYDAAKNIPGVVSSATTRLDHNKVRVDRTLQDRILFFPVNFKMVLEVTEWPNKGTDFMQISGASKSHKGSWRLEEAADATVFHYRTESEPDSVWPKAVVQYFIRNRLARSFEAMANAGVDYRLKSC
jgi:hypothetical protein